MSDAKTDICILVGSTRDGVCAKLACVAKDAVEQAGASAEVLSIAKLDISPCRNCDGCLKDATCVIGDDADFLDMRLEASDALIVFAPVFFAGPSAQLKAVYDRFQPRYVRRYVLGEPMLPKRPALLVVVGAGGDPFGYEPVVTCTKSALNVANFRTQGPEAFIGLDPKDPGEDSKRRMREIARKFTFEAASLR